MRLANSCGKRKRKPRRSLSPTALSEKWLHSVVDNGEITELFVKDLQPGDGSNKHLVGFYDKEHLHRSASDAARYSGTARGIFFRINPVGHELLQRSQNRLSPALDVESSRKADMIRRRLMMVDIDPVRLPGQNATQREKHHASKVRHAVVDFLKSAGWPAPAHIDTGNGYCLMYRVDLPTEDNGLIRGALQVLDAKFTSDTARVDKVVHDATRLARLPGTLNCKADPAPDRPQRRCRFLQLPKGGMRCVDWEFIQRIVDDNPSVPLPIGNRSASVDTAQVTENARVYIAKMPPSVSGAGGDATTYEVACRLVIGFGLSPEAAMPLMLEYNTRCSPPWSEGELRRKVDAAYQVAKNSEASRGKLASVNGHAKFPETTGANFHGCVADFGDASVTDVLAPIRQFAQRQQHDWIEIFAGWQKLSSIVDLPDVFLRQCYYGASYPRNWRRRFRALVAQHTLEEVYQKEGKEYQCPRLDCLLHGCDVRHDHFAGRFERWGLLEQFADGDYDDRVFLLYDEDKAEYRRILRGERKIIKVYWPALLFGQAKNIDWNVGQQRLLVGLAAELTLNRRVSKNTTPSGEIIQGNQVAGPANKDQLVTCPLLDAHDTYVTFGGNGRKGMRGRGYQIIGRTNSGWLSRAGYPDCRRLKQTLRAEVLRQFLEDLQQLAIDLDLIVVGYNHRHKSKWKGLGEMVQCTKSGIGLDWLYDCGMRVYVQDDWLTRWRMFFSKRLGFRWIPTTPSDEGPWSDSGVGDTDRQVRSGYHIKQLLTHLKWTQQKLADAASDRLGEPVSRRRVIRHVQEDAWNEKFLNVIEQIRRENGIELVS